ncbi:MAG: ribosome assembly cofactor RimP [Bacteroidota bacterium]|nr:ribosome assembly cofactor RimP [Bacteroidota bacterium]
MIAKEQILQLAEAHFTGTDKFVTNINVTSGNTIDVLIDGDTPVTIKDCVTLSRFIEGNLDREKEDFALQVSSHGAASPLVNQRQYKKHIGKTFEIKLTDNTDHEGELVEFNENELTLKYNIRENKAIGKGKVTVEKKETIPFNTIKESKIKLKF